MEEPTKLKQIKEAKTKAYEIARKNFCDGNTLQPDQNEDLLSNIKALTEKVGKDVYGIMIKAYCQKANSLNSRLYSEGEEYSTIMKNADKIVKVHELKDLLKTIASKMVTRHGYYTFRNRSGQKIFVER